jgi:hypothetical protein
MNNRWLCLSSNIVPWWQNNNLSTKLTKICEKTLPICSQKKYIEQLNYVREPIISVQAQRQARETIPSSIKCKPNYTVRKKVSKHE